MQKLLRSVLLFGLIALVWGPRTVAAQATRHIIWRWRFSDDMTSNALWTAAKYQIPLLIVVFNNRSYYNEEEHQERMAR